MEEEVFFTFLKHDKLTSYWWCLGLGHSPLRLYVVCSLAHTGLWSKVTPSEKWSM